MTRLLTTGAEAGDLLDALSATSASASAVNPHTGTYAVRTAAVLESEVVYEVTPGAEQYFRTWYYRPDLAASIGKILDWRDAADIALGSIFHRGTSTLSAYVGAVEVAVAPDGSLPSNAYAMIEVRVKLDDTDGVIQVRVDGSLVIDYAGDTKPGAETQIGRWGLRGDSSGAYITDFDDIAVNDTAGVVDNSWPGDGRVIALLPNAAGYYTDLVASAGDAYDCVNERPPNGDTDYVASSTVDQKSTYNLGASGLGTVTINRVWTELRAKKSAADPDINIATLRRSGATDTQGDDQALTTSYARYASAEALTNPATGAAWTVADLDALQAGAVVR